MNNYIFTPIQININLTFKIFLLSTLLYVMACDAQSNALSPKQFEKKMIEKKDYQLLDVRTKEEYKNGNLDPKAFNIDFYSKDFEKQLVYLDKNKSVFVYCFSGGRSGDAVKLLEKAGFKEIYQLDGGYKAWIAKKRPMQTNAARRGLSNDEYAKHIKGNIPVLVAFSAPWCPPCRKMNPIIDEIQNEKSSDLKVFKVDVDVDKEVFKAQMINVMPTLILYKNGVEVWRNEGYLEKTQIISMINSK